MADRVYVRVEPGPRLRLGIEMEEGHTIDVEMATHNIGEVYRALGTYLRDNFPSLLELPLSERARCGAFVRNVEEHVKVCIHCQHPMQRISGGSDEPEDRLSQPGAPSPGEVRARTAVVLGRVKAIADIMERAHHATIDPTTACAFIVLGASMLALPTSGINPKHLDLLALEMVDLGRAHAFALTVQATRAARAAKEN